MYTDRIELLIRSLGIGATYCGYHYLNYGIALCVFDGEYLLSINKSLYPEIAKEYHTTRANVERNIRTIIKICWERGNRNLLQEIALYPLKDKPTAGEFFDILVSYVRRSTQLSNAS